MSSVQTDSILYELFVYAEWRPDPDFIRGEIIPKRSLSNSTLSYILKFIKPEQTLLENVSSFINQLQPWQICLGDDGKVVAVLQDSVLEIRTKRGNYSTIVARAGVPRDPSPQWRKMVWSPDCSMLAIAHSNGNVSFYDLMATNLFNIPPDCFQPPEFQCTDTTHAVSGIIFLTSRVTDRKWSSEVLIVDYRGGLRSFFVSPTDGYISNHKFNFEPGVSSITYHPSHNILFVSGLTSSQGKESTRASDFGLRSWRLLNDSPFYRMCITLDRVIPLTLTSWLSSYVAVSSWKKSFQSLIAKAVASPEGTYLACLHVDGSVSLWHLPNLRFLKVWPLNQQPGFDLKSPLITNGKHKVWPPFENEIIEFSPIDINWWSTEAVIISRLNGSISICSTRDLHNMLGDNPEFLQGHPQISNTFDNGFLSLECEAMLISAKKLRRDSDTNDDPANAIKEIGDNESPADSSDEEKMSFASRSTEVVKTALYIITDMERFQPKPKKLNLLSRVYRLLCLRSTTPEDLYSRKIENADFTEALTLANTYNLDSDLVYQQQWRSSKVSHQSIKDYLGKVSKKIWVIQQCCDRVPEMLPAAKELLEFGLELSNEEILKDISPKSGRKSSHKNLMDKITLDDLSVQKSEMLRYRHTMLFYLDRLEIYKGIMQSEFSTYSCEEYDRLRSNTISNSAIEFARDGRVQALKCLWPHLNCISLQLLVLQNLPETLNPTEYKFLLPSSNSKVNNLHSKRTFQREKDWCEKDIFSSIWSSTWSDDNSPEETIEGLEIPSQSINLTDWFSRRAREIEKLSGLPNYALALITLAQERKVPGLEELKCLLNTLNTLIYDVNVEHMTLVQLEGCSQSQVSNYLMSQSTEETIIDDIKNILFPYLERCKTLSDKKALKESLFNEYVVNLSKEDLTLPIVILQGASELELNMKQCLTLVDGCLMAQNSLKQINSCFKLLDTLPKESDDSVIPSYFIRVFDEIERYLHACALLESHSVNVLFSELKILSKDPKEVLSILSKMARNASETTPSLNSEEWNELLADILDLHSKVFCCVDIELCYEIYASSLLSSANKVNIQSARQVLTCQSYKEPSPPAESHPVLSSKLNLVHKISVSQKIPYERSVALVMEAATEYFDSASSISDVSLEYAWTCLQLIKENNAAIQMERDLISALKIIEEFDLNILPIQVRMYSPKIGLIEDCLNCNNKTHKSVEKFIQLAKLLQISNEDDKKREVIIVSLCAEKAADNEDFEMCRALSRRLVTVAGNAGLGASEGERAARRLGAEPELVDPLLRRELLNLALLHCHPQFIENLVQIRSYVEAEMLQSEMNNLVNLTCKLNVKQVNLQDSIESTDDDYVDALTSPLNENKGIISTTHVVEKYIHKPLMALGDKKSWKDALNMSWINEKSEPESNDVQFPSLEETKIACHTFYSSLHKDCHISSFSTHYDKFSTPDIPDKQLVLLQALIRNNLLRDSVNYGCSDIKPNEALTQCAEQMLSEDTALFISQLLTVSDPSLYKDFFINVPIDPKTINSVLYFYALLNYMEIHNLPDGAFFLSPPQLVSDVIKSVESISEELLDDTKRGLLNCKDRYIELLEGEKLNSMGCDLNISLFINDEDYRREAVINIAKTSNKDKIKMAMNMASKYKIKEVEVALSHFTYILQNHDEIGLAECNKMISDEEFLNILKNNNSYSLQRLHDDVWISTAGNNSQGVILYFNLINNINSNYSMHGLNAKDHIKLVKKAKSACSSLDYKFLLETPQADELVEHLLPHLTKDNIGLVAKLLRNLPSCFNITFNSSPLYQQWLLKHFYDIPENLQSSKKWMQQYRECSGYFNKLKKEDMLLLAKEILFSDCSLDKVPANTRIQIANQTGEYCQHEQSNDEIKSVTSKNDRSWEDIGEEITSWGKFLEHFHSEEILNIIKNGLNDILLRNIEKSRGMKPELLNSFKELIRDVGLSTRNLKYVIEILSDNDLSLDEVLLHTLKDEKLEASLLTNITKRVIDLKKEGSEINENILDILKPYSTTTLLPSKQRLDLMSLYKNDSDYEDIQIICQISKEMILNTWSQRDWENCKEMEIADDISRAKIFTELITESKLWNELKIIVDLINMWPNSTSQLIENENPVLCLIMKLLEDNQKIEDNIPLLKLLLEKNHIAEQDINWIVTQTNSHNIVGKLWLCLLCNYDSIHNNTLPSIMIDVKDIEHFEEHVDDSLIITILNKGLFASIVKTRLYNKCSQFLLRNALDENSADNNCTYTLDEAVEDLLKNKFLAEAGSLKLASMGVSHALRGFTQALKINK